MLKKISRRILLFCAALFLSLGLAINHAHAQVPPFYWEFINVDIAVQTNGDMLVTETQKYTFTGDYKNQRFRYISLDKVDQITDVSVSENGKVLPSQTGSENNQIWIRWEHPLKAPQSHTFVLKYRVVGGLHVDNDTAQVYWKAIFADRKADVKQAKVQVKFPEPVVNNINNFQSFGIPADIRQVDAKTIEFVAKEVIAPQQELEVQVTFSRASIDVKTPQWQSSSPLNVSPWVWIIAFLIGTSLLAAIFGRWILFCAFFIAISLLAVIYGAWVLIVGFFMGIMLLGVIVGFFMGITLLGLIVGDSSRSGGSSSGGSSSGGGYDGGGYGGGDGGGGDGGGGGGGDGGGG